MTEDTAGILDKIIGNGKESPQEKALRQREERKASVSRATRPARIHSSNDAGTTSVDQESKVHPETMRPYKPKPIDYKR